MGSIGEILAAGQAQMDRLPMTGLIVAMTSATACDPDVHFVNCTGRTPAAGNLGVLLRIGGVFYLVGLRT